MGAMRKIVQLQQKHRTKQIWRRQHAMTGCSIVATIVAYHIGGNVMASMIVAMAVMKPAVPIIQFPRLYQRPPFQSMAAYRINSCATTADVWPNLTSAIAIQIVQMAKMRRIARAKDAVAINSG